MFRSIFMEGFARPFAGVRLILKNLVRRFRELGGELKLRTRRQPDSRRERTGRRRGAGRRRATAGSQCALFRRLGRNACGCATTSATSEPVVPGRVVVRRVDLDPGRPAASNWATTETIVFFNDSRHVPLAAPAGRTVRCPHRRDLLAEQLPLRCRDGDLPDGVIRITALANYDRLGRTGRTSNIASRNCGGTIARSHPRCDSCPISGGTSSTPTCSRPRRSAASPGTTTAPSTARRENDSTDARIWTICSSAGPIKALSVSSAPSSAVSRSPTNTCLR